MTLAADMITDLTAMFNTDEFAVAAVYTPAYVAPAVAAPVNTKVILDKTYAPELGAEGYRYLCLGLTSVFSASKPNETIVISGVTYKIKGPPHHTGDGTTEIELSID